MPLFGAPSAQPMPWLRVSVASATTSVTNNTVTVLSFDTVDVGNGWPKPTAPVTTITFPFTGVVLCIFADLDWADTAITISTGVRRFGHRNPSDDPASRKMLQTMVGAGGTATNQSVQSAPNVKFVTGGQQMDIICLQTSASTLNAAMGNAYFRYLEIGAVTFSAANT